MPYYPIPAHQKRQMATLRAAYRRIRRQKYGEVLSLDSLWAAALAAIETAPPAEKQNVLAATAQRLMAMDQPAPSPTSNDEKETAE